MDHASENSDENAENAARFYQMVEDFFEHPHIRGIFVGAPTNDGKNPADLAEQEENMKYVINDKMTSLQENVLEHLALLRQIKQQEKEIKELTKEVAVCKEQQAQATEGPSTISPLYLKESGRYLQQCRDLLTRLNHSHNRRQELSMCLNNQGTEEPTTSAHAKRNGRHFPQYNELLQKLNLAEKQKQEIGMRVDDNIENIDQAAEQPTTSHQSSNLKRRRSIEFSREDLRTVDYNPDEFMLANENVLYVFDENIRSESDMEPIIVILPMERDSRKAEHRLRRNVCICMLNVLGKVILREENEAKAKLMRQFNRDDEFWQLNESNEGLAEMNESNEGLAEMNESNEGLAEMNESNEGLAEMNESDQYFAQLHESFDFGDQRAATNAQNSNNLLAGLEKSDLGTSIGLVSVDVLTGGHNNATICEDNKWDFLYNHKTEIDKMVKIVFGKSSSRIIQKRISIPLPKSNFDQSTKNIIFLIRRYTDSQMKKNTGGKIKRLRRTFSMDTTEESESKTSP